MLLASFSISNHSRIQDCLIGVHEHLILVGPNDSGKSSVLRCLDLLLGSTTSQLYYRLSSRDLRDLDSPLIIEATFIGFSDEEMASFPDEINVGTDSRQTLTIRLEASFNEDGDPSISRTAAGAARPRNLSRLQLQAIGWKSIGTSVPSRDLLNGRHNPVEEMISRIELGDEQSRFSDVLGQFKDLLKESSTITALCKRLAQQLSKALPVTISEKDLLLVPGTTIEDDVLSGVRLKQIRDGVEHDLTEQSDGMRALYAFALHELLNEKANIVSIDEPEVHLHPASQRSLAKLFRSGSNQKILATHSPNIAAAFPPDCIVAVRPDGSLVQPRQGFLSSYEEKVIRWWVQDKLEPLTARAIIVVEGPSDRIILQEVADLTGRNLDRLGVAIVEADGSGNVGVFDVLFGRSGFNIPLYTLVDSDAVKAECERFRCDENSLNEHRTYVSNPDLEGEYIRAVGARELWNEIKESRRFHSNSIREVEDNLGNIGAVDDSKYEDVIWKFCRAKKKKVVSAIVAAEKLDITTASKIESIDRLLEDLVSRLE